MLSASLQKRALLLATLGTLAILAALGIPSFLAVRESINRSLQERLILAQTTADHLEYVLNQGLRRLGDTAFAQGFDLSDSNPEPEKRALHEAYIQSIFKDGVFLTDREGRVLWREPYQPGWTGTDIYGYSHVMKALLTARPVVSNVYTLEPSGRAVVSAVTPVRDREGRVVGLVGGDINPTSASLQGIIQPVRLGETGYIEVVDGRGVVLAGTNPEQLLTQSDHGNILANLIAVRKTAVGRCHSCHEEAQPQERRAEVMAFAPLSTIPWGVSVRQSEAEALALPQRMQRLFIISGVSLLALAVLLAWGAARSVVRPLGVLTTSAQRIARGDLSQPIPHLGEDELGQLAQDFDEMRVALKDSLEKIQGWNRELERRVQARTRELKESQAARGELLRKVLSAQEEERKRIARELHDDTSQAMAVLAMSLDAAATSPPENGANLKEKLEGMKTLLLGMMDGVHKIIFDLRPSVLDDLGLLPALRWYAESRLEQQGVRVHLETTDGERRLPTEVETLLFRVVQEAITNIAKHARADNVIVSVEFSDSAIAIQVEDDGQGFDVKAVTRSPDQSRGLGLLGMRERVDLLGGNLEIQSQPGGGTRVSIEVPVLSEGAGHE